MPAVGGLIATAFACVVGCCCCRCGSKVQKQQEHRSGYSALYTPLLLFRKEKRHQTNQISQIYTGILGIIFGFFFTAEKIPLTNEGEKAYRNRQTVVVVLQNKNGEGNQPSINSRIEKNR